MSNQFIFPKPKNWDIFEAIVCDVFARELNSRNFQRYGRSGQKQFGVDIVGISDGKIIGVQCKHFPNGKITIGDVEEEIEKAEGFSPKLEEFYFVTSADRDTEITSYVYRLSQQREKEYRFPVVIKFWDDIYDWLINYPDILYKHFTKYFPMSELENVRGKFLERHKETAEWIIDTEKLEENISKTMKGIIPINPYSITLGITTFDEVSFNGMVDLTVSFAKNLKDLPHQNSFEEASAILKKIKALIQPPKYSKEIFIHLQSRLPYSVLVGWMFRRVTGYSLRIFSSDQIWVTDGLPLVFTHLQDIPPKIIDFDAEELVFVVSVSRDIEKQVEDHISKWEVMPKAIVNSRYLTSVRISPALAMSMSIEISQRIKSFKDSWGIKKIHLFMAVPVGLATLIGYNLNSICPISIYFMDNSSLEFQVSGILTNDM
jgi:hypothetical protein